MTGVLFTVGYEGLVQTQLLDILAASGVQTVLDVRAVAASRKAGFSKRVLGGSLVHRGLDYVHDVRLGTPKAGRQAVRRGRVSEMAAIFDAHMRTDPAQAGLAEAISLSRGSRLCLLCFERDPHTCHRTILAHLIRNSTGHRIHHL